jgi:shikimate dehydrogenase
MSDDVPVLAGVIGWPIEHSKSPVLHNHWLHRYGIRGYYVPLPLKPQNFEAGLRALPKLGFRGANVTIPYKEQVLSLADGVTDRASLIGAANTLLFREDGSFRADNTDGFGFIQNLKAAAPDWSAASGPAVVMGAGGAARAVISALLSEGASEVRLSNRTRQRAENLKNQFGAKITVVEWNRVADAMDGATTIVNATSLGLNGQTDLSVNLGAAKPGALATDLVYTPLKTGFLRNAADRGLKVVDGLGMLLHQAVPGFETWFDHRPEVDDELRRTVLSA